MVLRFYRAGPSLHAIWPQLMSNGELTPPVVNRESHPISDSQSGEKFEDMVMRLKPVWLLSQACSAITFSDSKFFDLQVLEEDLLITRIAVGNITWPTQTRFHIGSYKKPSRFTQENFPKSQFESEELESKELKSAEIELDRLEKPVCLVRYDARGFEILKSLLTPMSVRFIFLSTQKSRWIRYIQLLCHPLIFKVVTIEVQGTMQVLLERPHWFGIASDLSRRIPNEIRGHGSQWAGPWKLFLNRPSKPRPQASRVIRSTAQESSFYSFDRYSLSLNNEYQYKQIQTPIRPVQQSLTEQNDVVLDSLHASFDKAQHQDRSDQESLPSSLCLEDQIEHGFYLPTTVPHHSHMMMESVVNLHYLESLPPSTVLLHHPSLTASQKEYVKLFSVSESRMRALPTAGLLKVNHYYTIQPVGAGYTSSGIESLVNLPFSGGAIQDNRAEDLIYISRRDTSIYRNLINEKEIEDIFSKSGFRIVVASELSAIEKVLLFRSARVVAGPLGAAFHYLAFTKNKCVISIAPPTYSTPELNSLFLNCSHRLRVIEAVPLKVWDKWYGMHSSFYLPPTMLELVLNKVLREC